MKNLFAFICAVLFFSSCSNEENGSVLSGSKEIRFSSKLSLLKSSYQGLQIANGQKVGIFIAEDSNNPTTTYNQNMAYTGDGTGNLSGATLYFPDNGNDVKISAYHPYNGGAEDTYSFSVATDQTEVSSIYASDLLYCPTFVQAPTEGNVVLSFKHLLSQINVSLTAGNGTPDLTDAQVSVVNAATAIEFNRTTGNMGSVSGVQEVKLGGNVGITVPQTVNTGTKFIKIVLRSGEELFYTLSQNLTLASGKKYTFNLVVNLTDVASIGTEVDEWETGETINGDASENLVEKLLPAIVIENYYGGESILKTVFAYDALNRVTTITRYLDIEQLSPKKSYKIEYTFEYDGNGTEITGYTYREYKDESLLSNDLILCRSGESEFTYGQGSVSIAYVDTETSSGQELVIGTNDHVLTGTDIVSFDENGNPDPFPHMEQTVYVNSEFIYDDKKNPFINSNMPGWLRTYLFMNDFVYVGTKGDIPSLRILTFLGDHNIARIVVDEQEADGTREFTLMYNNKNYVTSKISGPQEEWSPGFIGHFCKVTVEYTDWQ